MAGFFRQLAEQALRPATSLRSAAAAPFAGESARDAAVDDAAPEPTATVINADAGTRAMHPARPSTAAALRPGSSDGDAAAPKMRGRPASAPASADDVETPVAPGPRDERLPVPRNRRRTATADAGVPALTDDAGSAARRGQTSSRTVTGEQAVRPRDPGRILPAADARAPIKAAGLVPSHGRTAGAHAPASSSRTLDAKPVAPEVHIHIGRIELTAATAAHARGGGRDSGPERKPMSLDAYLQKRGRKSP
jgi:hypothetical protein